MTYRRLVNGRKVRYVKEISLESVAYLVLDRGLWYLFLQLLLKLHRCVA